MLSACLKIKTVCTASTAAVMDMNKNLFSFVF